MDEVGVCSAGTQEGRVEAGLARLANGANRLADDGAQDHKVAVRRFHLRDLRGEIGGAAFEGGFFGEVHADGLECRFAAAHHLQAKLIVLINGADLLGAFFLDQLGRGQTDLVVVGGGKRILELVEGLVHFPRCRHREEVDHVLAELHGHGRQVLRRADVRDHHEDLVLVHELLRGQHGFLGVVARVFHFQVQLAAVHAALLVGLVHAQHHPQAYLFAKARERAGQILDGAQRDGVLAHALAGLRLGGGTGHGHEGQRGDVMKLHGTSPSVGSKQKRSLVIERCPGWGTSTFPISNCALASGVPWLRQAQPERRGANLNALRVRSA